MHQASADELGGCYAPSARRAGSEGKIEVLATIEPDGSVSEAKIPPGIEPWQEEAAHCVIKLLRFDAAVKDGVATRSQVIIPINFDLLDESVITPPRIQPRENEEIGKCYSKKARRAGSQGRLYVQVVIEADGSLGQIDMPEGIEPWAEETARCVLGKLKFLPGTRDGVPVAAMATLPIQMSLIGSPPIEYLKLASTQAEIEEANRACYPPDSHAIARAQFRVTVTSRGKATHIEIVESTGDPNLDEAGVCILNRMKFIPAKSGKVPVESTSVLPVTLTPPK